MLTKFWIIKIMYFKVSGLELSDTRIFAICSWISGLEEYNPIFPVCSTDNKYCTIIHIDQIGRAIFDIDVFHQEGKDNKLD